MWPNQPDTQVLLERIRNDESAAVDQLLAGHREPVRRMIEMRLDRAVAARVDASDVVQEVLLEASRRIRDYVREPSMPFHLWIRHIAKDHIVDAHRRHRLAKRRTVDREQSMRAVFADRSSVQLIDELINRELTPASAAIRHEMQRRFQEVVDSMDDDDREVILMRHFEQLSNQEVAAALELTEAAASMRYLRAMRRLRELLSPA
jgi:RNA polymerase sigma-70 factor (ECF subfamily)